MSSTDRQNRLLLAELKVSVWLSVSVNIPAKSTEPPFVKDNCVPTSERVWFALPPNKFPVSVKSPTSAGIVGLFVKLCVCVCMSVRLRVHVLVLCSRVLVCVGLSMLVFVSV